MTKAIIMRPTWSPGVHGATDIWKRVRHGYTRHRAIRTMRHGEYVDLPVYVTACGRTYDGHPNTTTCRATLPDVRWTAHSIFDCERCFRPQIGESS